MEPLEPTNEQCNIFKELVDSLADVSKQLDSITEQQISSMKRPEPAKEAKFQDLGSPKLKRMTINQQVMIAIVAIHFGVYVLLFDFIEDIRSNPLNIFQLGSIVTYALIYEFVFTAAACPHWYPLWLMHFIRIVTPFYIPLRLWITLHCYRSGYKGLAIAMAGCLAGHFQGQVKIPDTKTHEVTLDAVKKIYQEAYDQMKEDLSKSLDEAYALLRKETIAFRQENLNLWEKRLKEKEHYADESAKELERMKEYQDSMFETKSKYIETMERLNTEIREGKEKTKQEQEQRQLELLERRLNPWSRPIRWRPSRDACGEEE
ncbi:MAG: hypothetical protein Q9195_002746 [Heterodermia aff. obscurata]